MLCFSLLVERQSAEEISVGLAAAGPAKACSTAIPRRTPGGIVRRSVNLAESAASAPTLTARYKHRQCGTLEPQSSAMTKTMTATEPQTKIARDVSRLGPVDSAESLGSAAVCRFANKTNRVKPIGLNVILKKSRRPKPARLTVLITTATV